MFQIIHLKGLILVNLKITANKNLIFIETNLPKEVHLVDNICKKAFEEAKKPFINNIANGYDIIEISIRNNVPFVTKSNNSDHWRHRRLGVINFVEKCCKLLDPQNPINLVINVGLHDSYHEDFGIMVFSLRPENKTNLVIPDLYAMGNYGGKLNNIFHRELDNNTKIKCAFFVGASTGSYDAKNNERLQLCNKYVNHQYIKC